MEVPAGQTVSKEPGVPAGQTVSKEPGNQMAHTD